MSAAATKRALLLLPQEGFDDETYRHVRAYLGNRGVEARVASGALSLAKGERVDETAPDLALDAVDPASFDAAIVIGGEGGASLADDPRAHRILRGVAEKGGVVGAAGSGVLVLARAGLLKGKKVTGDASQIGQLVESGARWKGGEVVTDGRCVTAGPGAGLRFAAKIGLLLGR
ncbi:MAG TPA: DJ-1/PfpI family protein [Planctomycetota bacterium]|jgi:putative intracellular protease/amidase|nr:DJ-1/PfpI family protein [Planctomycetota bacterium]